MQKRPLNYLVTKKQKCCESNLPHSIHEGEVGSRAKKYFKGGNGGLVGIEVKWW